MKTLRRLSRGARRGINHYPGVLFNMWLLAGVRPNDDYHMMPIFMVTYPWYFHTYLLNGRFPLDLNQSLVYMPLGAPHWSPCIPMLMTLSC